MASIETIAPASLHKQADHTAYPVLPNTKQVKRLSLNFPILLPMASHDPNDAPSPAESTPTPTLTVPIRSSPRLPILASPPTHPNTFLTSLAAQERRVLELREELQKAEADLSQLKNQWAQSEAGRKKSELRQVERLQPLQVVQTTGDSHLEMSATPAAALRASLENGTDRPLVRKSTQRVFSGSRHARALSLLSPGAIGTQTGQTPVNEVLSPRVTAADIHSKHPLLPRSSTLSSAEHDFGFSRTYRQLAGRRSMPPPAKDAIVNSSKKMASDLREGLWTFFEDIRQATVGEEGINGTESRTLGSGRTNGQDSRKPGQGEPTKIYPVVTDVKRKEQQNDRVSNIARKRTETLSRPTKDKSFWKEFGLETPSAKDRKVTQADGQAELDTDPSLIDADEGWDIWDSPAPPSEPPKQKPQEMTSQSRNDGLPWPRLAKVTPTKLSRTVSDLMKEWESPALSLSTRPSGLHDQPMASPHI